MRYPLPFLLLLCVLAGGCDGEDPTPHHNVECVYGQDVCGGCAELVPSSVVLCFDNEPLDIGLDNPGGVPIPAGTEITILAGTVDNPGDALETLTLTSDLGPGEYVSLRTANTYSEGTHLIVQVDPTGAVLECSEQNNMVGYTLSRVCWD